MRLFDTYTPDIVDKFLLLSSIPPKRRKKKETGKKSKDKPREIADDTVLGAFK